MPRLKKQDQPQTHVGFEGFPKPERNYFSMPGIWIDICAGIDNLAELKVIQYVLRHTWGYREYDIMKHITVDEFVRGRWRRDGTRMDRGTGLSERAVRYGLQSAVAHSYLLEQIDSSDRGRIKKYYALKMLPAEVEASDDGARSAENGSIPLGVQSLHPDLQNLPPRGARVAPRTQETTLELTQSNKHISNGFDDFASLQQDQTRSVFSKTEASFAKTRGCSSAPERAEAPSSGRGSGEMMAVGQIISQSRRKRSRDTAEESKTAPETALPSQTPLESQAAAYKASETPKRGRPPKLPPYLEGLIDRYSEELHDEEHQPQNRGQAARLWKASGQSEAGFGQLLIEAKSITLERDVKKRASVGGEWGARNKMPYYFVVLRDLLGMKDGERSDGGVGT
jgi:hypothetical protein